MYQLFVMGWNCHLLSKLPSYGLNHFPCYWHLSFSISRRIHNVIDGDSDNAFSVMPGTPQGSVFFFFSYWWSVCYSTQNHSFTDDSTLHAVYDTDNPNGIVNIRIYILSLNSDTRFTSWVSITCFVQFLQNPVLCLKLLSWIKIFFVSICQGTVIKKKQKKNWYYSWFQEFYPICLGTVMWNLLYGLHLGN